MCKKLDGWILVIPLLFILFVGCDVPLNLEGIVTDSSHKPVSNAEVIVTTRSDKVLRTLKTDANGHFRSGTTGQSGEYKVICRSQDGQTIEESFSNEGRLLVLDLQFPSKKKKK